MIPILEEISNYAYSTKKTIQSTYDLTRYVIDNNIEGDLVECGVAAGAQIMTMKVAIDKNERVIWAFDSFEGIPLAGENDIEQPGIGAISHNKNLPIKERLVSSGITVHSLSNVINNFNGCNVSIDGIMFIEGWFQDTVPGNKINKISLLRLDGDLYESTEICLKYLYPKVSVGGVVIIDDYALDGAKMAVCDYFNDNVPEMKLIDGGVVYFIKK
jgi:O-methyltransferase/8-demethyl-8-(2,3-dimethoxy-alpha-L-rhamnosyl)tetracenomycin-C 4'-O-methyltransferase